MGVFSELIDRKFRNIAERRYEDILEKYKEFFLTEEELVIPDVNSILMMFDHYSEKPTKEVYDAISTYPEAEICLLYTVDENVAMLIAATLGEGEAKKFREAERNYGEVFLEEVNRKLKELGFKTRSKLIFGNKNEEAITRKEKYDFFVFSRKYGAETSKTSPVSPLITKIVQHIEKPIMVY